VPRTDRQDCFPQHVPHSPPGPNQLSSTRVKGSKSSGNKIILQTHHE
jgi:hypothetical protein